MRFADPIFILARFGVKTPNVLNIYLSLFESSYVSELGKETCLLPWNSEMSCDDLAELQHHSTAKSYVSQFLKNERIKESYQTSTKALLAHDYKLVLKQIHSGILHWAIKSLWGYLILYNMSHNLPNIGFLQLAAISLNEYIATLGATEPFLVSPSLLFYLSQINLYFRVYLPNEDLKLAHSQLRSQEGTSDCLVALRKFLQSRPEAFEKVQWHNDFAVEAIRKRDKAAVLFIPANEFNTRLNQGRMGFEMLQHFLDTLTQPHVYIFDKTPAYNSSLGEDGDFDSHFKKILTV